MFRIQNKYTFIILFTLGFFFPVNSQSISNADKFSSFSFGIDYMGDYNVNGRVNTRASQPNLTSTASYFHKSGVDISLMYTNIWNSDITNTEATQELDLSLGYSKDFTKWLSGMASYSYFTYSKNANSLQSDYKHLISGSLYSEVNWWLADANMGYYSGNINEFFISFDTGILIEFDNVLKKDNTLSFEPMVMINMGDIGYYDMEAYTNYLFLYNYSQLFPSMTAGEFMNVINDPQTYRERVISERLQSQPKKIQKVEELPEDKVLSKMFEEQKAFNLNNIGFTLPVYYYWGDFMINLGFSAFKPVNQPSYVEAEWRGYANAGLTYFMSW